MRFEFDPRTLVTSATSPGDKVPASKWFRVGRENKGRGAADFRAFTGTGMTVILGVETATDPRSPDTGYSALWATGATANGPKDPDGTWNTLALAGKLYWRFVWVIYVTSGTGWVSIGGGFGELIDQ